MPAASYAPQGQGALESASLVSNATSQFIETLSWIKDDTSSTSAINTVTIGDQQTLYTRGQAIAVPTDCYIVDINIEVGTAPGAGTSYEFMVVADNGPQRMSAILSDTDTTLTIDDFSPKGLFLRKGDLIDLRHLPINTPAVFSRLSGDISFAPVNPTEKMIFFRTEAEGPNFSTPVYHMPFSNNQDAMGTQWNKKMPVAGTFKDFTSYRTSPQENAGDAVTYYLRNETTAQEIIVAVHDNDGGFDFLSSKKFGTSNSLYFNEGDEVSFRAEGTATTTTRRATWSCVFVPDDINENQYHAATQDTLATIAGGEYRNPMNNGLNTDSLTGAWTATKADATVKWPYSEVLSDFRLKLNAVPNGSGVNIRIRNDTTATQVEILVGATETEVSDLVSTLTINKGDDVVIWGEYVSGGTARSIDFLSYKGTLSTLVANKTPETNIVAYSVLSAVLDTSIIANAVVTQPRNDVQLVVSTVGTKEGFEAAIVATGPLTAATTLTIDRELDTGESSIYYVQCLATGLTKNTEYYYAYKSNSAVDTDAIYGPFTTMMAEGEEVAVTVTDRYLSGSCSDPEDAIEADNQNGFNIWNMAADLANIRTGVHMGDFTYHNSPVDDKPLVRRHFLFHLGSPDFQKLYNRVPFIYTPSDHDVGPSDHNATTSGAKTFYPSNYQSVRDVIPLYPSVQPQGTGFVRGVATKFSDGKVGHIILDTQCQRHPTKTTGLGPTMIGDGEITNGPPTDDMNAYTTWDQRQWLKDTLLLMKSVGIKLVILAFGGSKFLGSADTWTVTWLDEWKDICDFICDNTNDIPEIVGVWGDEHNTTISDGTEILKFNNNSGMMGFFHSSPFGDANSFTPVDETWNGVTKALRPTGQEVITVLEVTKNPALHEYTYEGKILEDDGTTFLSAAKSDGTRTVDWNAASSSLSHPGISGTHTVTLDKTWIGPAQADVAMAGTLTHGTDYTIADSMGNTITPDSTVTTHPHADTTDYIITFLTATTGTITLTLSLPDTNSVLGATTVHTVTLS